MNSPTVQTFDPLEAKLQGISLIEASAGTGKTYNIEILLIRLILEKKLDINRILAVTFTEAATEELRTRIRQRLHAALSAFESNFSDDALLMEIVKRHPEPDEAVRRLSNALRGFDEAAIFTIHSFCRQMLKDNAFTSGILFDTEVMGDQMPLLREIVEDFWRQHFYEASPLLITYAIKEGYDNPMKWLEVLGNRYQYVGQAYLKIIPHPQHSETTAQEETFQEVFTQTREMWHLNKKDIEALLLECKELNRTKYALRYIPKWCQELDVFFNTPLISLDLPEKFTKFTSSELTQGVKKNLLPPQHPFFEICEQLYQSYLSLSESFNQYLLALKINLFKVVNTELTRKKHQKRIQSYDDLLINLHLALANQQQLVEYIRKKYQAALIDEFQDTDPVQYEIFKTIFGTGQHILFLIGDPKQAIYSFRGADIFTYMSATHHTHFHYTLTTNWRSEEELIVGVNTLFNQVSQPFIFKDIPFHPVHPSRSIQSLGLANPLQIWFVPRSNTQKPISKGSAEPFILLAVGNEIVRLLTQMNTSLIAGDIAVLVRKNSQARAMQKVLTGLGVPSVLYSRESLFSSHEIMEIEHVLLAVANPNDESLAKAALTTEMLGMSANQLYRMMNHEYLWRQRLHRFQKYHSDWQTLGFIRMFRKLLLEENVLTRLLSYPDGERRLTNVLHACELLHQISIQQKLGLGGLCQWLSQQRYQRSLKAHHKRTKKLQEVSEEHQLRLESDEKLVKIVTIHKSKGLEYPIVFCPFVWDGRLRMKDEKHIIFHDENETLTLDLGSEGQEKHRQSALLEEKAENLRLFYVAVTRAKHRCYLIWGVFNEANTSAPASLWHPNTQIEEVHDEELFSQLKALAAQVTPLQFPIYPLAYQRPIFDTEQLTARPFLGHINKDWQVASFTFLTSTSHHLEAIDRPDYDEAFFDEFISSTMKPNIFSFPRGARAGNFMHSLFENLDFTQAVDPKIVHQQLRAFGYDTNPWQEVIATMVADVLATPLEPKKPEFTLSCLSNDRRLNEIEFYYPLHFSITHKGLQAIFSQEVHWLEKIGHLEFSPVRGFMKGFIDLIFEYEGRYYLVDYKSNFLGYSMQAYHSSNLFQVMTRQAYFLQYHIYAVALHRYLSVRLTHYCYEQHFGGIYYLFLRGMRPHWGAHFGIYHDLPRAELIEQLSAYLSP